MIQFVSIRTYYSVVIKRSNLFAADNRLCVCALAFLDYILPAEEEEDLLFPVWNFALNVLLGKEKTQMQNAYIKCVAVLKKTKMEGWVSMSA